MFGTALCSRRAELRPHTPVFRLARLGRQRTQPLALLPAVEPAAPRAQADATPAEAAAQGPEPCDGERSAQGQDPPESQPSHTSLQAGGAAACDVFISHMGQDTGSLAGWLHRELTVQGLSAFLDHRDGPQPGDHWPSVLRQAASSCRVFIVLLSPSFFLREWPVRELNIALARQRADAAAVSVIPVYCGWTRQQAAAALQEAAVSGRLSFTHNGVAISGPIWQPAAQQTGQQAAAQVGSQLRTLNSLQQQLTNLQQPNGPRVFHEHYKLIEVEVVREVVRAALIIVGWQYFEVPTGVRLCAHPIPTSSRQAVSLALVPLRRPRTTCLQQALISWLAECHSCL